MSDCAILLPHRRKFIVQQATKTQRVSELCLYIFRLTSALDVGGHSKSRLEKDTVPFAWEAGWASGPVWTGAGNLAYTGIRSLEPSNL